LIQAKREGRTTIKEIRPAGGMNVKTAGGRMALNIVTTDIYTGLGNLQFAPYFGC